MRLKRYQPQHLNTEKKRRGFPASALIVYLLIAVTLTTGVSFSRYTTTVSGSDSARVAKFEVSAFDFAGQKTASLSTDNRSATYTFKVSSSSEVAVEYDVILEFPAALPDGVAVTIDGKQAANINDGVHTFTDVGRFMVAGGTNDHTMQIVVSVFEQSTTLENISVKVVASQID